MGNAPTNNPEMGNAPTNNPDVGDTNEVKQDGGKKTKKKRKNRKLKKKINKKTKNIRGGGIFDRITNAVGNLLPTKKVEEVEDEELMKKREGNEKTFEDFKKIMKKKNINKDKLVKRGKLETESFPTNFSKKEECNNKKLNVEIAKGNSSFREFIRNHDKMKDEYVRFNKLFLDLIDNNLIKVSKTGYEIKNISEEKLDNIEKETRKNLIDYYTTCQKNFTESFALLVKGVNESGISVENNLKNDENKNSEIKETVIKNN